jgi:hypothetical protein
MARLPNHRLVLHDGWTIVRLTLVFVMCAVLSGCTSPSSRTLSWDVDAERKLLDGKFSEAIAICDAKLATDPQEGKAHVLRGRVFMLQAKFEEALAEFSAAQKLHPTDVDTQYRRADALRALGRVDESHHQHQQARMQDDKLEAAYSISPSEFYEVPTFIPPSPKQPTTDGADEAEAAPEHTVPSLAAGESENQDREPSSRETQSDLTSKAPEGSTNSDNSSATESLGGSFTQGQKERDASRNERQSLTSPGPSLTKSRRRDTDRGMSGRLGSLTEEEPTSSPDENPSTNEPAAKEDEEPAETKPRPVISSALPRSFEENPTQGFGTSGLGSPASSNRRGMPKMPLTTGLQSQNGMVEPSAESNLSGGGGAFPGATPFGNATASPPQNPYARINPVYAPKKGMFGGIGPAVTLGPPPGGGLGGRVPSSESPRKATLSTSLPGTAPIPADPTSPKGTILSTSLPGTAVPTHGVGKPASLGTSLLPGMAPYKGIPSGNLKKRPTPNP